MPTDDVINEALARRSLNMPGVAPTQQFSNQGELPTGGGSASPVPNASRPAPMAQAASQPSSPKAIGTPTQGMRGVAQIGQSPAFDDDTRVAAKNLLQRLVKYL